MVLVQQVQKFDDLFLTEVVLEFLQQPGQIVFQKLKIAGNVPIEHLLDVLFVRSPVVHNSFTHEPCQHFDVFLDRVRLFVLE